MALSKNTGTIIRGRQDYLWINYLTPPNHVNLTVQTTLPAVKSNLALSMISKHDNKLIIAVDTCEVISYPE